MKQGYKLSPLGPIPEDWEVKRLGEVCTFHNGRAYNQKELLNQGKYRVLRVGNFFTNNSWYYSSLELEDDKYANDGDLLYAWSASFGPRFWKGEKVIYHYHIWKIDSFRNISNSYLYSFLFFDASKLKKNLQGGTMVHVTKENMENRWIPLPSLPEQQRIVSVLSLWDTAIEKQTALIEKLTLRKRGLMQQLLTGKKRLEGFSGEWKRVKAGEIFKSISVKGNGSEVLLSATQEHGVIPRDQLEGRVTMPTGDTNSFKLVEVGDFVISLRSFQGGLEYSEHRGIVSPAYTVLKPIVEIDKSFYRYYFKSAEFIGHLAIAVIGIRDGKQISYDDFCFVKIPYPNIEEQKAISSILLQADIEIELANKKLARLQEEKRGLMQVLLTGKKRVK